ncbi:S-layer homology domain-containing protein [Paenibacillus frigoriresistens]|uniref:S-layer homology domain-containing protein n=1 Tax=Paenibacillus alginolyticus TaxID=59839 RepID=UPI001564E519|nr:S-layer homology domain-containing protein [Paenibacillus frigoriresistens]NRF96028.1 S-layer homology domain-containing protein [Paenibacillus frigoriresistens]
MVRPHMKKLVVLGLTIVMTMGSGTAAFAKGKSRDENFQFNHEQSRNSLNFNFRDVQSEDWDWAARYIADLAPRQVFQGYNDGTFRPQNTVTRIEAITAAVRVMGLKDQAESSAEMQTHLNFKDADQVPSWAVGYVAVAVENDLFSESDTKVNPDQPADRLWATTLLVKALKLQSDAEAKMNSQLTFADAQKIPAGSVGFVAEAVEKGLVNGFEDNTFRPNQSVTRAEIAALLDRAGGQLPNSDDGLIAGTVSALVNNNVLTITTSSGQQNLTLDPNVFVFRGGARVSASALQVGDVVRTRSINNDTIYVEVTQPYGTQPVTQPIAVNGVVTGSIAAPVTSNVVTLSSSGTTESLTLNSNAIIFRGGVQVSASSLQVGDVVTTRSYNNAIVYIDVTQPAGSTGAQPNYEGVVSGTVASPVSNNVLPVTSSGQTLNVTLGSNAFVYRGGVQVSASALQVGDVINVYTYNNSGIVAEVTNPVAVSTTEHDVLTNGIVTVAVTNNILNLQSNGQNVNFNVSPNAFIYRNGVQVSASSLQANDVVTVYSYNNTVVSAEVTQPAGSAAQLPNMNSPAGVVVSSVNGNVLSLSNSGQTKTLDLNPNAFIYKNGVQVTTAALQPGDTVVTHAYNNNVIYVEVTGASNQTGSFSVSGIYNGMTLNNQGIIATISVNQTNTAGIASTNVYNVSPTVSINGTLSQLVTGHNIILQGNNGLVSAILIQ